MTTPQREHDGLWVCSQVLSSGHFGVSVHIGREQWELVGDQVVEYAKACFTLATAADYDVAVFRLLTTRLGLEPALARRVLVGAVHWDRPELHQATAPLRFTGVIDRTKHPHPNPGSYVPRLSMSVHGRKLGLISPQDLRIHAAGALEVQAAATMDSAFSASLAEHLGLDKITARGVVQDLQNYLPEPEQSAPLPSSWGAADPGTLPGPA
jgi:hypothetical protein